MAPTRLSARRAPVAVALLVSLLAAGCGSTVQQRGGDVLSAGAGGDGLSVEGGGDGLFVPGEAAADGGAGGLTGSGAEGGSGASSAGSGTTAGSAAGGSSASGSSGPGGAQASGSAAAPGVTADKIYIGVAYTANADAANSAIGASGITGSDQKKNATAVIDEINARGGVAGRTLVPVFHAYDAQSSQSAAEQDAAACATFTQDNRVFATGSGLTENFAACMQKAGVIMVNSGQLIDKDSAFYAKYPDYFDVGTLTQDRMMAEQVRSLRRLNWFSGWDPRLGRAASTKAKVGVLSFEDPSWERPLRSVLLPALAAAGHPVDPGLVYRVHKPENQSDVARTAAATQNAVLRFNQSGVTHVVLLDVSGLMGITYAAAARNQRYYPRLGINSASGAQALYDSGVFDAQMLSGAAGLGWFPSIDLPAGQGDAYLGPATKSCLEMNRKRTGQTFSSTNAASLALAACDQYFLIAEAMKRAGATLNRGTVRAALEQLGGAYSPALIPASFFSPTQHDGLRRGWDMAWDDGCRCAKYRDAGHDIP